MRTCLSDSPYVIQKAVNGLFSWRAPDRFSLATICAGLIYFAAGAQDAAPVLQRIAQDQLTALASRVADHIRKSQIDPTYTKLFVFDFPNQGSKEFTKLGSFLADRFSESLASQADGFVVSDRKLLTAYLKENLVDLKDLQGEGVALGLARSLGAAGVIKGDLQEDPNHQLLLPLQLQGFGPMWATGALFPLTDEMQTLLNEPLPSFAHSSPIPEEPNVLRTGVDGVGAPECVYCPPLLFTDIARIAKYQGTIELSVIVTQDGRAESIFVLKGAPFGLNQQAIETVQKWKFKPVQRKGKPVSVRVPLEITLRVN